jgi:hypothetical protein
VTRPAVVPDSERPLDGRGGRHRRRRHRRPDARLALHRAGIACRVYEAGADIRPLGVGINVLPHATAVLQIARRPGRARARRGRHARGAFYNRFGQLVYDEPLGRWAGHATPQLSIHRADLQAVLLAAVRERIGAERVVVVSMPASASRTSGDGRVRIRFRDAGRRAAARPRRARQRSAATASIRRCAGSCIPTKGRRAGRASTCGAASCRTRRPRRRDDGAGRLARRRQDGDLSDQERHRRRRRHLVNWVAELECREPCAPGLGTRAAASTSSCRPSPTGTSTGSTSPS